MGSPISPLVACRAVQTQTTCRVCGGRLEFTYKGRSAEHGSAAFSPSFHRSGAYSDLYRCGDCGTVQQPAYPQGAELHDLYREMSDEHYLDQEEGRRRTARGLLDLLGAHVPRGRLLEVGCGHGLLLDEARRRGYEVHGLELSVDAARYARETLGLEVRENTLEAPEVRGELYDAVLLVDVIEHVENPVSMIECSCALLAPGGALMIVTPDPSALPARMMRRHWWGFLPAHLCLIPRKTLIELMSARGLVLAEDVQYMRSFTLGYWLAGLAEVGGWAGSAISRLLARLPRKPLLRGSMLDEPVLIARRS
jgi:SAM-dependent methyltransferase